jgi:sporulation protein YlmC with PRC-barrel domain
MDYWAETMQDDAYLIADGGWKAETYRVVERKKDKNGKETVKDKGWACDEGSTAADMPGWRQQQIAAAVPVIGSNVAFRSDELLGVEVRTPGGAALGSVDDLILSPDTGKIAYLVVARGGIFGFDETRIPIPWDDFKAAPNASLLVLDTTKTALDAPKVEKNAFVVSGEVGSESQKVDAYWKANQPAKAVN